MLSPQHSLARLMDRHRRLRYQRILLTLQTRRDHRREYRRATTTARDHQTGTTLTIRVADKLPLKLLQGLRSRRSRAPDATSPGQPAKSVQPAAASQRSQRSDFGKRNQRNHRSQLSQSSQAEDMCALICNQRSQFRQRNQRSQINLRLPLSR